MTETADQPVDATASMLLYPVYHWRADGVKHVAFYRTVPPVVGEANPLTIQKVRKIDGSRGVFGEMVRCGTCGARLQSARRGILAHAATEDLVRAVELNQHGIGTRLRKALGKESDGNRV